jgi:hypothetical protein
VQALRKELIMPQQHGSSSSSPSSIFVMQSVQVRPDVLVCTHRLPGDKRINTVAVVW